MKKILFALMLLPVVAVAQPSAKYQPPTPTPWFNTTPGAPAQTINAWAADEFGRQQVVPIGGSGPIPNGTPQPITGNMPVSNSSAPNGLNGIGAPLIAYDAITNLTCTAGSTTTCTVTSSSPRIGDVVQAYTGTAANINAWSVVTGASGTVVTFSPAFPSAVAASDIIRLLRPVIVQTSPLASIGYNGLYVYAPPSRDSPVQLEDAASANGDFLIKFGAVREDALTANTSTTSDWTQLKTDSSGRLITTMAPMGETFQSCGTATATTSDVAIKAAVASNRMYVTGITCASSDADNATNINFKDGSTVIAVGGVNQMAATSSGTFVANFPVPLRGTANTALNFNTAISTSSVICCASGYVSTQ